VSRESSKSPPEAVTHTKGQTWAALKKCWRAYKIAKVKGEEANMVEYAKRVRSLQLELGLPQAPFPELGLT
jgi:hypothetical protein